MISLVGGRDSSNIEKEGVHMGLSVFFLVVALIVFAIGAWSRWWASPQPYYPTFICAGLFFWVLSILWPQLVK